ncbi:ATP-binding cassette domain-containing protein, partial [Paracidovorax cattleyae]
MSTAPSSSPSAPPLLRVQDLRVAFGGKEVVHGVGFDIGAGEKLALVGESGSGKTITALSLLRLVADAEMSGRVLLQGRGGAPAQDLLALPEREIRGLRGGDIAMVFQEPMT